MHVLELGNYIIPAYAGMVLAEQGATVTKWTTDHDPILGLEGGQDLWEWINAGKHLEQRPVTDALTMNAADYPDLILDNFRPDTLARWHIDPIALAERFSCVWVSMRSEVGDRSFDLIAQCRSWLEYGPWLPLYVGDTTGGLWLAFKALAMYAQQRPGHYVLGQATCMQKLVEGELVVTPPRDGQHIPWDQDAYYFDVATQEAVIDYRGTRYREPVRDEQWKRQHLWHEQGRMRI